MCATCISVTIKEHSPQFPVLLKSQRNCTSQMSLFRQGWKAEEFFGSELTAHHMNTRSVYRFKENSDIAITHSAKYVDDGSVDVFVVSYTEVLKYHESGTVAHSQTSTVDTFDNWLDAYYCGVQCVNNLNMEMITN